MSPPVRAELLRLWAEIHHLQSAMRLLEWDQETGLPPAGVAARGAALATLAGLRHARLIAPALAEAVEACAEGLGEDAEDAPWAALVRESRRRVRRAVAVPQRLVEELAAATSGALAAWLEARQGDDFVPFRPHLERVFALKLEEARCLDAARPYDALLDEHDPGSREEALVPLFAALSAELVPLVAAVAASGRAVDESPARGDFALDRQRELGVLAATAVGFDFAAGRLDRSAHPFCTAIARGDVRLTWRGDAEDFRPAFYGILHEVGHGLYDQGLPEAWQATPLGEPVSLAVHESQSRLWENLVGRRRSFWRWLLPHFRRLFPAHAVEVEALWPTLHAVRPSLVRVEADAATYHLHVIVRFELERALATGDLAVADLPGAWDELYARTLGIRPPGPALGVLQDLHWASGAFGYFPTYTLGTLAASQLFAAAAAALGDLDAAFAAGDFAPLLAWLREHVHRHGSCHPADELLRRATGRPLEAAPFLADLRATVREVYGVAA